MIGDALAFLAFAVIGLSSHYRSPSLVSLLRAGLRFLSAWLMIGTIAGVFRPDAAAGASVPRLVLPVWVPARVLGLGLRALVFGRAVDPAFAVVSLIATPSCWWVALHFRACLPAQRWRSGLTATRCRTA